MTDPCIYLALHGDWCAKQMVMDPELHPVCPCAEFVGREEK